MFCLPAQIYFPPCCKSDPCHEAMPAQVSRVNSQHKLDPRQWKQKGAPRRPHAPTAALGFHYAAAKRKSSVSVRLLRLSGWAKGCSWVCTARPPPRGLQTGRGGPLLSEALSAHYERRTAQSPAVAWPVGRGSCPVINFMRLSQHTLTEATKLKAVRHCRMDLSKQAEAEATGG